MTPAAAWELVQLVRSGTDRLLGSARSQEIPAFIDAVDAGSLSWSRHDVAEVGPGHFLSNLACQQTFLRLLVGLSEIGAGEAYRDIAREVVQYAFAHFADPAGLLCWGGHVAVDLESLHPIRNKTKGPVHELKGVYPFYELMWAVNPLATERFIEAFWNAHVRDWSILDFDRHGRYGMAPGKPWSRSYAGGDPFFWGNGLTFVTAGSELYYAAGQLATRTGDDAPLGWARHLAHRYVGTRQGTVGISGYQFSQKATAHCNGPSERGDRAQHQIADLVPASHLVLEGTLFRPRPAVQRCLLRMGEILGEAGRPFHAWAVEELEAWACTAYRIRDNTFLPMLTDGFTLEGLALGRDGYFGKRGDTLRPVAADADFFWAYTTCYRLSGSQRAWETARHIARALGLGDVGTPSGKGRSLMTPATGVACPTLWGLLDLYVATGFDDYLHAAWLLAQAMASRSNDGLFDVNGRVLLDDARPITLLLVASHVLEIADRIPPLLGGAWARRW